MPTFRRRVFPRRGRRVMRRPLVRKRRFPMSVGRVKRIIDAELKISLVNNDFVDIFVGTTSIVQLSSIAQGDTNLTRTGNWIKPITTHGYIVVKGFPGAVAASYGIRVGIVRWNNDQSVDPVSVLKLMFDAAIPAGSFSFVNKGAFKVVWTRYVSVVNNTDNSQFLKTLKYYIRLSSAPKCLYNGATNKKFQYFVFAMSDDLSAAEHPSYQIDNTFRFTDS